MLILSAKCDLWLHKGHASCILETYLKAILDCKDVVILLSFLFTEFFIYNCSVVFDLSSLNP